MGAIAFAALGFLIGNLVGLTGGPISASTIALLFAFGGGSAVGFLPKLGSGSF